MTKLEVFECVSDIIRDVFDEDKMVITEDTYLEEIEDWDSVAQMTLMAMVENEFKVHFGLDQIVKLKSVDDIVEHVLAMRNSR